MNILILNWKDIRNPNVGGAEIIVYELARRLVKDRHTVTWYCGNFVGGSQGEEIDGIKIIRRGQDKLSMYLQAPIYYWGLKKKPDLVIDMSNTIFWQTPLWAWKSKRIAYLNQLAQEVFLYEYPLPLALLGIFIERVQYLTYAATKFICYSESTKEDLQKMGIKKQQIKTFLLGLDQGRYTPGKKSKTPLFICVNRLVKMKRTDLAIKAMKYVKEIHPNARLVIAGYGYERKQLETLRDKLALRHEVHFLDENVLFFTKTQKDQKVKMMQQAWALVFPSVKEGWGMTVTESAACGTLTIATDVTGLKDSVVDGKTGILVPANVSPEELAKVMDRIIEDEKLRHGLSKNAFSYSQKFSWDKSYKTFSQIING